MRRHHECGKGLILLSGAVALMRWLLFLCQKLWCTLENENPECTRWFMGFSGSLKPSGTLWVNEILRCTRGFIGFSGSLKNLWYTWANETLGVPEVLWVSMDFRKPLVHFRGIMLLYVPEVYSFRLIFRGGTDF